MIKFFTKRDFNDLTEGIRKRPPHKWKKSLRLTPDQRLVNNIVDNRGEVDVKLLAKKYDKTSSDIITIINELGLY